MCNIYFQCFFPPSPTSVNPLIVNNFFAGKTVPGLVVVSASSGTPRRVTPVVDVNVPPQNLNSDFQADNQTIIGCKASGRPKPRITWYRTVNGGNRERVDVSLPGFDATDGEGQSTLTVALSSGDTNCYQYICVADNGGMPAEGSAEVCPIRKDYPLGL